jgi:hypothetical protein
LMLLLPKLLEKNPEKAFWILSAPLFWEEL